MRASLALKAVSAGFAVAALAWAVMIGPALDGMPEDFTYAAEIDSVDDLYDEEKGEFGGEIHSDTTFGYEVFALQEGVADISAVFDVRDPATGERIFRVDRLYGVDPRSGSHVPGRGDLDREGYLLGPKFAFRRPYAYWHINYNVPVQMEFQAREVVHGLAVHRYESRFMADQTVNLGHLPGVPDERGVELDVNLEIWIEPVSGHLVNYRDRAEAWYYDRETGERLHPWNRFRNTFTDASVEEQVGLAKEMRARTLFLRMIVPGGLLLISAGLLIASRRR